MANLDLYVSHYARPDRFQKLPNGDTFKAGILYLDDSVLPNAPYFSMSWYCAPCHSKAETHTHDFDEYLGFVGSDPNDPTNLNGVVRIMIDDEWVTLTESTVMFIPAGVKHCPYIIERVDKPIIHWTGGDTSAYKQIK